MPDPCQPIQNRVNELEAQKSLLQEELKSAPPPQKPGFKDLIVQVSAQIATEKAALKSCRLENPAPIRPPISMQFSTCLGILARNRLEGALNDAFDDEGGVAHSRCVNGTERIGIWTPAVGTADGRVNGLEFVNLLRETNETFGFGVQRSLLQKRVREAWNNAPKSLDEDGEPDPDGPIVLTSFTFRLESPNRVITTIEGFRRVRLLPDVDFTMTTTDTLSIEDGNVVCNSSTHVDADFNVLQFIVSLLLGPIGLIPAIIQIKNEIYEGSLAPENANGGIGCGLLGLLPTRIQLPGNAFLSFDYTRIEAFTGSLAAGGTIALVNQTSGLCVTSDLEAVLTTD